VITERTRLFNAALEQVKGLAAAYAGGVDPPRPVEARDARSVSDAAADIASVLIVSENERAEALRLVGAHRASVNDKDPLALVAVPGRLAQPVVVATGVEAGEFFVRYGRVRGGGEFSDLPPGRASARPFRFWATCGGLQARGAGLAHTIVSADGSRRV
jgi:hypothetical protein